MQCQHRGSTVMQGNHEQGMDGAIPGGTEHGPGPGSAQSLSWVCPWGTPAAGRAKDPVPAVMGAVPGTSRAPGAGSAAPRRRSATTRRHSGPRPGDAGGTAEAAAAGAQPLRPAGLGPPRRSAVPSPAQVPPGARGGGEQRGQPPGGEPRGSGGSGQSTGSHLHDARTGRGGRGAPLRRVLPAAAPRTRTGAAATAAAGPVGQRRGGAGRAGRRGAPGPLRHPRGTTAAAAAGPRAPRCLCPPPLRAQWRSGREAARPGGGDGPGPRAGTAPPPLLLPRPGLPRRTVTARPCSDTGTFEPPLSAAVHVLGGRPRLPGPRPNPHPAAWS